MKHCKIILILVIVLFQSCDKKVEQKEEEETVKTIENVSIYTIGDSTMADKPNPDENPERG